MQLIDVQLQRIDLTEDVANAVYQRMQQSLIAQAQQLRAQRQSPMPTRSAPMPSASAPRSWPTRRARRSTSAARPMRAQPRPTPGPMARNPEFAAFYRSLQAYKNTLGREGDILVIAPEGEFFKYLHSASGR